MKKISVVISGAGGYAGYLRGLFGKYIPRERFELRGVVDPLVERLNDPVFPDTPLYNRLDACLDEQSPELVVVASPIMLHRAQCVSALSHGAAVLCEKPLTPCMADNLALEAAADAAGKPLGVGFQWSFCQPMLSLKRDILAGRLGAPRSFKTLISWKRFDDYYAGSWKGHIRTADGSLVNDSVATNATAHYLHNLFFLSGDRMDTAAMPIQAVGSVYRGKPIQSFDTCFLRGRLPNGASFLYAATHSGDETVDPILCYEFDDAVVVYENSRLLARYRDGRVKVYGDPQSDESCSHKLLAALDAAETGAPMNCTAETVRPHTAVCEALFSQAAIAELPTELRFRDPEQPGWFTHGLTDVCRRCYQEEALPTELGVRWAVPETELSL